MSILLSCNQLQKSYPSKNVFENLCMVLNQGEKIGLVGANGAGKSTLLKILAGMESSDGGDIARSKMLKSCYIPQDTSITGKTTCQDFLLAYAAECGIPPDEAAIQVPMALSRSGFEQFDQSVGSLSGGWQKRLFLARMFMGDPDLVFLDEPTNHLDWEGIEWLEQTLRQSSFAWLMVSHDRYLLNEVTNAIAEIDPIYDDGIKIYRASYDRFLEQRQEFLTSLQERQSSLANKVKREQEWLRRQPKARSTKSRSRIETAEALIGELGTLKQKLKKDQASLDFQGSGRKTKRLVVAEDIAKSFADRSLFKDLSFILSPGTKYGILGRNGSGKSTLLKIVTGELSPDQGQLIRADQLKVVYFSQARDLINEGDLVKDALTGNEGDFVRFQDNAIHVVSWGQRFLFKPEHMNLRVGDLSGGERARLNLARLMLLPADILLLDEPTNDLDLDSIVALEETLSEFKGALVLVSHDRRLMDNLCDLFIGLGTAQGGGVFASIEQWQRACQVAGAVSPTRESRDHRPEKKSERRKLSYKEQWELDRIEGMIQEAESDLATRQRELEDPKIMSNSIALQEASDRMHQAQARVDQLYSRWTELEEKKSELE